eukprot:CAMPEP_0116882704 /NCGR_PEP_ID=MMETSP0463-20121206/15048_1 /TAXON_ID=181622 /ORGANISM="Strombidinopsis sp, Strain SopsisLIS2011" /LENGTH=89 /DNA_ID=CAMNT_0004536379 /DNA_START=42 /DNA_END=311 /DNA_ORIENTATION=+
MIKRLKTLHEDSDEYFTSTSYINIERITLPKSNEDCIVYDMSGQGRYRESWSFFYTDVDGIFFVVDASDKDRISIVKEILYEIARHPGL